MKQLISLSVFIFLCKTSFGQFMLPQLISDELPFTPLVEYQFEDFDNDGIKELVEYDSDGYLRFYSHNNNLEFKFITKIQVDTINPLQDISYISPLHDDPFIIQEYYLSDVPVIKTLDYNADGLMDIAMAFQDELKVLIGLSNLEFSLISVEFNSTSESNHFVIPDLNNDSKPEIVSYDFETNNTNLLLSNINGYSEIVLINFRLFNFDNIVDLEGDGDLDICATENSEVTYYRNDGEGTFTYQSFSSNVVLSERGRFINLDADPEAEWMYTNNACHIQFDIYDLQSDLVNYSVPYSFIHDNIFDYDNDGDLDLFFNQYNSGSNNYLLINDGTTFSPLPFDIQNFEYAPFKSGTFHHEDLNGDSLMDFYYKNYRGIHCFLSNGNSSFQHKPLAKLVQPRISIVPYANGDVCYYFQDISVSGRPKDNFVGAFLKHYDGTSDYYIFNSDTLARKKFEDPIISEDNYLYDVNGDCVVDFCYMTNRGKLKYLTLNSEGAIVSNYLNSLPNDISPVNFAASYYMADINRDCQPDVFRSVDSGDGYMVKVFISENGEYPNGYDVSSFGPNPIGIRNLDLDDELELAFNGGFLNNIDSIYDNLTGYPPPNYPGLGYGNFYGNITPDQIPDFVAHTSNSVLLFIGTENGYLPDPIILYDQFYPIQDIGSFNISDIDNNGYKDILFKVTMDEGITFRNYIIRQDESGFENSNFFVNINSLDIDIIPNQQHQTLILMGSSYESGIIMVPFNTNNTPTVEITAFQDNNSDGIQQPDEPLVNDFSVFNPGNGSNTTPDEMNTVEIELNQISCFELQIIHDNYPGMTTHENPICVNPFDVNTPSHLLIGLIPPPPAPNLDLFVELETSKCDLENQHLLTLENTGNVVLSGEFCLTLPIFWETISIDQPIVSQNGNVYCLEILNLAPDSILQIEISNLLSDTLSNGQYFEVSTSFNGENYSESWIQSDSLYCPQAILTFEEFTGIGEEGFVDGLQPLHYRAEFTNTGNQVIQHVALSLQLSNALNISSFQPIESNFEYSYIVESTNLLVEFENIQLSTSDTDTTDNMGYFEFEISLQPDLSFGTIFQSTASATFDELLVVESDTLNHFYYTCPEMFTGSVSPLIFCGQDTVYCTAESLLNGEISWYSNGQLLSGENPFIVPTENTTIEATFSNELCQISTTWEVSLADFEATIESNSNTLVSSLGESYEWYLNNELIVGENEQTLEIDADGSYFAVVTNSAGCTDTSNVLNMIYEYVTILDESHYVFYPNPFHDYLQIPQHFEFDYIIIFNAQGQIVYENSMNSITTDKINCGRWPVGLYTVLCRKGKDKIMTSAIKL